MVIGAILGMAGSFTPSAQLRGLAWGVDGIAIAIAIASALLVVHHGRKGNDQLAAGLTPLSKPLPYFADPFLALTLVVSQ